MKSIFRKHLNKLLLFILKISTIVENQFNIFILSLFNDKDLITKSEKFTSHIYTLDHSIQDMIHKILVRNQVYGMYLRFLNSCTNLLTNIRSYYENTNKLLSLSSEIPLPLEVSHYQYLYDHLQKISTQSTVIFSSIQRQNTKNLISIVLSTNELIEDNIRNKELTLSSLSRTEKHQYTDIIINIFDLLEKQVIILGKLAEIITFILEGNIDIFPQKVNGNGENIDIEDIHIEVLNSQFKIDEKSEMIIIEMSKLLSQFR